MGLTAGGDDELGDTFGEILFRGGSIVAGDGDGLGLWGVG